MTLSPTSAYKYYKNREDLLRSTLERYIPLVQLFAGLVLLLMLLNNLLEISNISAWRHDSIYYIDSYKIKLIEEGRWLNYIFFKSLKFLNPYCVLALSYGCLFFFSYRCAVQIVDKASAILIALAILQIGPFYSVLHWPVTPFPSFVLLAIAAYVHEKIDFRIFFYYLWDTVPWCV